MSLPGDPYLPPGVSQRDLDEFCDGPEPEDDSSWCLWAGEPEEEIP